MFNIDDDAYRLLDNYLHNLRQHFRKEAGADEIVDDIERRISELFCEKQTEDLKVITLADVEQVIARIGRPEEMEEDVVYEPLPIVTADLDDLRLDLENYRIPTHREDEAASRPTGRDARSASTRWQ